MDNINELMAKHAAALRPKFDAVLGILDRELSWRDARSWVKPDGGYFITYMTKPGCAKRVYSLCKDAGVTMTDPGATHPYHKDPDDSYLRICPSYPSAEELAKAMQVFTLAVRLASVESLLA